MQGLVGSAYNYVVGPCLEADESYSIRSRKLAVIVTAVLIFNNIVFLGVPVAVLNALYQPSTANVLLGLSYLLALLASSIIPYGYLRKTRKLPDWVPTLQMWSTAPMLLLNALFIHQSSVLNTCSSGIMISVVMRIRGWQVFLVFGLCLSIFTALVTDFTEEIPELHDMLYSTMPLPVKAMFLAGTNIGPVFFLAVGLRIIITEFVQKSDEADGAIAMNKAVAEKLRRYDTDGVAVILAANKGKVDENLLDTFTAIQHNLQEYRPHIPEYIIASTLLSEDTFEDGKSNDEGSIHLISKGDPCKSSLSGIQSGCGSVELFSSQLASSDGRKRSSQSREEGCPIESGSGEVVCRDDEMDGRVLGSSSDAPSSSPALASSQQRQSAPVNLELREESVSVINVQPFTKEASGDVLVPIPNRSVKRKYRGGDDTTGNSRHRQHFYGRATTVFIRFVSEDCGSDDAGSGGGFVTKGGSTAAVNVLCACIDAASKHAMTHRGAMQYMQGCGLMVSFNAASRVMTHEASACAFALALQASVDDISPTNLVVHTTIVTTNVLSFFAGDSGQLMLTVLGRFMPIHTAMHHHLSQTIRSAASCILLNESVVPTIDMMYDHRLLGGISLAAGSSRRRSTSQGGCDRGGSVYHSSTIHQLLCAKATGGDGEWLYQAVERDVGSPIVASNVAIRAALEGGSSVAPVLPSHFNHCDTTDMVCVKCIKERLEECKRSGVSFVETIQPTSLW